MYNRFEKYHSDYYRITAPYFCIIGMPRSGSIFFGQLLNANPELTCYGEILSESVENTYSPVVINDFIGNSGELTQVALDEFLQNFVRVSNKKWGFRVFMDHNDRVLYSILKNHAIKKIVLIRDLLDTYISLQIAIQTNQWLLTSEKLRAKDVGTIKVDIEDFSGFVNRQSQFYGDLLAELSLRKANFLLVEYADLVSGRSNDHIEKYLGLDAKLDLSRVRNIKQNTIPAEERVTNYSEVLETLINLGDASCLSDMFELEQSVN